MRVEKATAIGSLPTRCEMPTERPAAMFDGAALPSTIIIPVSLVSKSVRLRNLGRRALK